MGQGPKFKETDNSLAMASELKNGFEMQAAKLGCAESDFLVMIDQGMDSLSELYFRTPQAQTSRISSGR